MIPTEKLSDQGGPECRDGRKEGSIKTYSDVKTVPTKRKDLSPRVECKKSRRVIG